MVAYIKRQKETGQLVTLLLKRTQSNRWQLLVHVLCDVADSGEPDNDVADSQRLVREWRDLLPTCWKIDAIGFAVLTA